MDGKHVVIQAPHNSGSQYYTYKGTYSLVLLAVVNARYLFRVVDVGAFLDGRVTEAPLLPLLLDKHCGKRSSISQKMLLYQALITWGQSLMSLWVIRLFPLGKLY